MTISGLIKKITAYNISSDTYSILKNEFPNEQLCLFKREGNWEVYYSERGRKSGLKVFNDENTACNYFFGELKKMLDID